MAYSDIELLKGQTITSIEGAEVQSDEIVFTLSSGKIIRMYHDYDCCETVYLEDIQGEILDLLDPPLIMAEESTNSEDDLGLLTSAQSFTWTFYWFATI